MKPNTSHHHFDVIIVGSGFGGSVCAARLAEKGMNVLVLERGPWWGPLHRDEPKKDRCKLPRGLWGARKYLRNIRKAQKGQTSEKILNLDGLLEIHKFDHLTSVTSSGVGGGSQIYTSILEKPTEDFFEAYPPQITASEMEPYFERVRQMIRPAPIPDKPEKNRVFERAVAEAGLPNISSNLGKYFSPNGDLSALVWRSRVLKDSSYGSSFNAYSRISENGSFNYLVGEVGLPVHALPIIWPLNRWLKKSTYLFGMGRDASRGTIEFDGEALTTAISQSMDRQLFTRIQRTIDAIGEAYQPKKIIRRKDLFTVHPMGGCSTGRDATEGVTDHRGQVFNYPGLYVADGSLYPRSPGIAPSLTIAAMAERIAEIME